MRQFAVVFVLSLACVGCFSPRYQNGHILCAVTGTQCPHGYHCAGDSTCWKNGEEPTPSTDMGSSGGMCQVDADCNMPPNLVCYSPTGTCTSGTCSYRPKVSCANGDCCAPIHGACDPSCSITCDSGFGDCDTLVSTGCEADLSSDAKNCNACGNACAAPANGVATCMASVCGYTCNTGFVPVGNACEPIGPPRPVAPLSTSTVTSHRPTFKWVAGSNAAGARLELSRDRTFMTGVTTVDSAGASGAPPADLTAGHYFWRLRGAVGSNVGSQTSAVWEFTVTNENTPIDNSFGTSLDFDGDGFADVAIYADMAGKPSILLYRGGKGTNGLASNALPDVTVTIPDAVANPFTLSAKSAGDVNGDGFADLIIGSPDTTVGANAEAGSVYIYYGGPNAFAASRLQRRRR